MKCFRNRFNLKPDVRDYTKNTDQSDNRTKRTTVPVTQRNKICNTADFIDSGDPDNFTININPSWNNNHRSNVNRKII